MVIGTVIHELLHAIGIFHEQSRHDRGKYIKVIKKNVMDGKWINFARQSSFVMDTQGLPYDYGSVMHYSRDAFGKYGFVAEAGVGYGCVFLWK